MAEENDRRESPRALRVAPPSAELLQLSGVADEPLRETHAPFRIVLRDAQSETRPTEPPASLEEALVRAARSSFASAAPAAERLSGLRLRAAQSIEEALVRVTEAEQPDIEEPLRERYIPNT